MYEYNPYADWYYNYLAHHGIKNQQWGVRHGPPYPLNKKVSNRIKNPKKYKYKVGKGWYTISNWAQNGAREGWSSMASVKDRSQLQVQFHHKSKELNNDDRYMSISGLMTQYGEEKVSKIFKNIKKDPDELIKMNVNPSYGETGTTNNCAKCTAALALSKMGFNVEAGRSLEGRVSGLTGNWFKGAQTNEDTWDNSSKYVDSLSDDSYGEICISRSSGSGHSMFWYKDNGSFVIKDGQTNHEYRGSSTSEVLNSMRVAEHADLNNVSITPLNNTTPDWAHMNADSVVSMRPAGNFARTNLPQGDANKWIHVNRNYRSFGNLYENY